MKLLPLLFLLISAVLSKPIPTCPGVCAPFTAYNGILPDLSPINGKPFHSWNHVQVFAHTGRRTFLTDDEKCYFATHPFATITIPKFEGIDAAPIGTDQEAKITDTASDIKVINPNANPLAYINSIQDFENYNLHCKAVNLLLKTSNNKFVTLSTQTPVPLVDCKTNIMTTQVPNVKIFDHTKLGLLDIFKNYTNNMLKTGKFSGFFYDHTQQSAFDLEKQNPSWKGLSTKKKTQWTNAHKNTLQVMGKYNNPSITIMNNVEIDTKDGDLMGYMIEQVQFDFTGLSFYGVVKKLQRMGTDGRVVQYHAKPCGQDTIDGEDNMIAMGNGAVTVTLSGHDVRAMTLGGFLIGACKYSYYSCVFGFVSDKFDTPQTCWQSEYNQYLGPPLGAAKQATKNNNDYFYRVFAGVTVGKKKAVPVSVFFKTFSRTSKYQADSCICWGDGTELCTSGDTCAAMNNAFVPMFKGKMNDTWDDDGCA